MLYCSVQLVKGGQNSPPIGGAAWVMPRSYWLDSHSPFPPLGCISAVQCSALVSMERMIDTTDYPVFLVTPAIGLRPWSYSYLVVGHQYVSWRLVWPAELLIIYLNNISTELSFSPSVKSVEFERAKPLLKQATDNNGTAQHRSFCTPIFKHVRWMFFFPRTVNAILPPKMQKLY